MYCRSYPLPCQACKVILTGTLFVTQAVYERTFSKLRYIKNRLRNQLSEDPLGFPSFDVRRTRRFVTHFEPYDHRRTS